MANRQLDAVTLSTRLHQLKVNELKECIKLCNGLRSGNKPVLIERVRALLLVTPPSRPPPPSQPRHRP